MPKDALLALQASVAKTAAFDGTQVKCDPSTLNPSTVIILVSTATTSSGAGSVTLGVTYGTDGSTIVGRINAPAITLSTTAVVKEVPVSFVVPIDPATNRQYAYIGASVVAISGTGASVTYSAKYSWGLHQ